MNIKQRVTQSLSIEYESRLMVFDRSQFSVAFDYCNLLTEAGFEVIQYNDVELFRLIYEEQIRGKDGKFAVIISSNIYVPFDIIQTFFSVELTLKKIFPNLHVGAIMRHLRDIELISQAYDDYADYTAEQATKRFIKDKAYSCENIRQHYKQLSDELQALCDGAKTYIDFIEVAKNKAKVDYYAYSCGDVPETSFADAAFERFINDADGYGSLSQETNTRFPPILPKALQYIKSKGNKVALIVMDGMSLFDFEIISRHFDGIEYEHDCTYALIPTTTAISRQALLSSKFPRELSNPFSLSREEREFKDAAAALGYNESQVLFGHGFDIQLGATTKLVAIIINDIDDMIHGQKQGRQGQLREVDFYGVKGKLQKLIKTLYKQGFTVYITADHGNTQCVGMGSVRGSGVETETKSKRAVIYKGFADSTGAVAEHATEYDKAFYLDKSYKYYICKNGVSFDNKGDEVITHGGYSIDEVVVPFIAIKAVK